MADRVCRLALPAQGAALDVPEDPSILLLDSHTLVGELVEKLCKSSRPGREFGRQRQQAEGHLGQAHLGAILSNAVVETGPPDTQGQPAPAMRTVGMLQHLSQVPNGREGKIQFVIIRRIMADERRQLPQFQDGIDAILPHHFLHGQQNDPAHAVWVIKRSNRGGRCGYHKVTEGLVEKAGDV